jgi:fermentation-respiration switch protein FrsA (DUF1100 family)
MAPRRPTKMRLVWTAFWTVVLCEIALPLFLLAARNSLLFFPQKSPAAEAGLAAFHDVDGRVVRVVRPDGRALAAYDVAPRALAAGAPVVLFFHGNAGNIAGRAQLAAWFARVAGVRLLMPDYSGYGGNAGSPSEGEIEVDALAAYDHLVADGVDASRIVVFGESIGGGPALHVATNRAVAGVALQSTLSSLSSMAWRQFWWLPLAPLIVSGRFDNVGRIARVAAPTLIVHGTHDSIVPFGEGEKLAAAQPKAEFLRVEGADHNDLFDRAGDEYLRGLGERFRRWTGR